ncbi:NAD(P)-binding domain-containing protein [Pelagibacterales bacterium SAG-MED15]|nr:NAD(P)-binding domain-containing protein [Pelagibacterales bacterium SAG-MED15]
MKLGFIGTGEISKAVIQGIISSKIKFSKIYISNRNNKISKQLSKLNKKISIIKDNQKIIDTCEWVFLAITPAVGKKIIKELKFKKKHTIISFISTIKMKELKKFIKVKATIVRAIPLPPISLKKGPIPIYPPNKKVKRFFNYLGTTVEIKNEALSLNFWTTSSMMAPFYEILYTLSQWLIKKGVKKESAQKYITSLFVALSEDSFNKYSDLKKLVKESQTPKGLNEQSVKELRKLGFYRDLNKTAESVLSRLKKAK